MYNMSAKHSRNLDITSWYNAFANTLCRLIMPVHQWFLCYCYCMWFLHLFIFVWVQLRLLNSSLNSLTWLSINQNSLGCTTRFSVSKNLSVVVEVFLCHSPGCPVIHDPRQVCVDLVNMNSRVLVPWNDSDFTTGFIKWSQLFLALFKAYRIYYQEFFIISKKYFLITIYFFTRGVDSQFAEISWIKHYKLIKGNSTMQEWPSGHLILSSGFKSASLSVYSLSL